MKKVATNTLATLVLIGIISLSSINVSAVSHSADETARQQLKRLERIYQHHDRKHELRASVLGVSADELRAQLKRKPLETIVKKHGFRDALSFYTALTGKLKDELRRRGWSERKIEVFVQKRLGRLSDTMPKSLVFGA